MNSFETIIYHKAESIAFVSLNRPTVLNAYNLRMRDELYQVLEAVRDDSDVKIAVLRGGGRAFCVGADLTEFGTAPSQIIAREVRWERDVWGLILSISKPLIASMHGYCLGLGLELALLCDLRIAAQDAVLGMPEIGLGMLPSAGGTQTLSRVLGVSYALEMLLTGRYLTASEALDLGLVGRVVTLESLDEEVLKLAQRLLSIPEAALRAGKEAVHQGLDLPLEDALGLETRLSLATLLSRRAVLK